MERVEVAVVGSGVTGSAAARALGARGVRTVLLEQFGLGHSRGSSHGATRIFRLSYPDADYVRMAVRARGAWTRLQDDAGEELLVTTGGLDTGPGAQGCASALEACGVDHVWLEAADVRTRFPGVAVSPGERMLFQAESGVCLAGRTVAALQRLCRRDGVQVRERAHVLAIDARADHAVLRTTAGELSAGVAIVAAGAWSQALLDTALARVPELRVTVQQVRYFAPRHGAPGDGSASRGSAPGDGAPGDGAPGDGAGRWPTLIEWTPTGPGWYTVPMAGEAPGVKVAAHAHGRTVDPRDGPFSEIDPALEHEAAAYVSRRLPGLDPAGFAAETCLYTMTADEDFVLDRAGSLVVGAACSGHGFKFGPFLGEVLADLALGDDPGIPRDRFSLSRPRWRPHIRAAVESHATAVDVGEDVGGVRPPRRFSSRSRAEIVRQRSV